MAEVDQVRITLVVDDIAIEVDATQRLSDIARQIERTLGSAFSTKFLDQFKGGMLEAAKNAADMRAELERLGRLARVNAAITGTAAGPSLTPDQLAESIRAVSASRTGFEIFGDSLSNISQSAAEASTSLSSFQSAVRTSSQPASTFARIIQVMNSALGGASAASSGFISALGNFIPRLGPLGSALFGVTSATGDMASAFHKSADETSTLGKFLSGLAGTTSTSQRGFAALAGQAIRVAFAFSIAYRLINLIEAGIRSLVTAVKNSISELDEFRLQVIEVAGIMQLMAKAPTAETFEKFQAFAIRARQQLEALAPLSIATSEQLFRGFLELTERGVIIETTEQFKDLINIMNLVALVAAKVGSPVQQAASEMRALIEGQGKISAEAARALEAIHPGILENIRSLSSMQERFMLLSNVARDFSVIQESIGNTLKGQVTLFDRIVDRIQRLAAAPTLDALVQGLKRMNESLLSGGRLTEKALTIAQLLGNALEGVFLVIESIVNLFGIFLDLITGANLSMSNFARNTASSSNVLVILLDMFNRLVALIDAAVLGVRALLNGLLAIIRFGSFDILGSREKLTEAGNQIERIGELLSRVFSAPIGGPITGETIQGLVTVSSLIRSQSEELDRLREISGTTFSSMASDASALADTLTVSFERSNASVERSQESIFDRMRSGIERVKKIFEDWSGSINRSIEEKVSTAFSSAFEPVIEAVSSHFPALSRSAEGMTSELVVSSQVADRLKSDIDDLGFSLNNTADVAILASGSFTQLVAKMELASRVAPQLTEAVDDIVTSLREKMAIDRMALDILKNQAIPEKERVNKAEELVEVESRLLDVKQRLIDAAKKDGLTLEEANKEVEKRLPFIRSEVLESIRLRNTREGLIRQLNETTKASSGAGNEAERLREKLLSLATAGVGRLSADFIRLARDMDEFVSKAKEIRLPSDFISGGIERFREAFVREGSGLVDAARSQVGRALELIKVQMDAISKQPLLSPDQISLIRDFADAGLDVRDIYNQVIESLVVLSKLNLSPEARQAWLDAAAKVFEYANSLGLMKREVIEGNAKLREQLDIQEKITAARESASDALERETLRRAALNQLIAEGSRVTKDSVNALTDFLEKSRLLSKDPESQLKLVEASAMQQETDSIIAQFEDMQKFLEDLSEQTARSMHEAFRDFFFNAMKGNFDSLKDVFTSFLDSILKSLSAVLAEVFLKVTGLGALMRRMFESLLSSVVGNIGGAGIGSLLGGLLGLGIQAPEATATGGLPPSAGVLLGIGGLGKAGLGGVGTTLGVSNAMFLLPILGALLGGLGGGLPGAIKGGITGAGALGGAIGGAAISSSLGIASGSLLGTIIPGIGTIIGGILGSFIGGALSKLFGGTKPRLEIDIPSIEAQKEILSGNLMLTVQDFMNRLLTESGKEFLIGIKGRKVDVDVKTLRDQIANALLTTIASIESVLSTLPTGIFGKLDRIFRNAVLNFQGITRDIENFGLEFDKKGKDIAKSLEQFLQGEMQGALIFALRGFFETALRELGLQAESAQRFVSTAFESFQVAESREARAQIAQQFLSDFSTIAQAASLALGQVAGDLEKTTNSALILARTLGFDTIPTFEQLREAIVNALSAETIDVSLLNNIIQLRNAMVDLVSSLAGSITQLAEFIDSLNAKIVQLGGSAVDVSGAIRTAIVTLQNLISQGGLSFEERQNLLQQMAQAVDQLVQQQLALQQKQIQAQIDAIGKTIDALEREKDLIRENAERRIDALKDELALAEFVDDIRKNIRDLLLGSQSIENPFQRLARAQRDIDRLFRQLGRATTVEEKIRIGKEAQDLINQLLSIGGEVFQQPSLEFRDQFRSVIEQLEALQEAVGPTRTIEEINAEIERVNKEMNDTLKIIDARIEALRQQQQALQSQQTMLTGQAAEEARAFYEFIRSQAVELMQERLEQLSQLGLSNLDVLSTMESIGIEQLTVLRDIRNILSGSHIQAQSGFVGVVSSPTRILAGERGPEFVSIMPIKGGMSSGGNVSVNIVVNGNIDSRKRIDELSEEVIKRLRFSTSVRRKVR